MSRPGIALVVFSSLALTANAQYTITSVAGGGPSIGSTAAFAAVNFPTAVAASSGKFYYVSSYWCQVFRVSAARLIDLIVGTGVCSYSGDGGQAANATLSQPAGIAVDASGNIFIADSGNNVIRKVNGSTNVISTVAGNGIVDFSGDGGAATAASLAQPSGIAVDAAGNLFIADQFNSRIRKVTASNGLISTVAGNGQVDFTGDGGAATSAALSYPGGVAVDGSGNLFILDSFNVRIRKVSVADGKISTVAGNGNTGYNGDGIAAVSASMVPNGVALDASGNIYIADGEDTGSGLISNRIRKVTVATGVISTITGNGTEGYSGDGSTAGGAALNDPVGVAVDGSGNIFIADYYNQRVRKVTAATGIISTAAGTGFIQFGGDNGQATLATLGESSDVVTDTSGNLFVMDFENNRVRKVSSSGVITTVAGNGGNAFAGDGGQATAAGFHLPTSVAVDAAGNIFISESGSSRIRKVSAGTGIITTYAGTGTSGFSGDNAAATAAKLNFPEGIVLDASGNLYIADSQNYRIRKVAAGTGVITTVAGNGTSAYSGDNAQATAAGLSNPIDVAVDSAGNLFIADVNRVRKVTAATGVITTYTGTGTAGFSGEGAAANTAKVSGPQGLAVDASGNLFISDTGNSRVRMVNASTGIITTLAGNGTSGFSGDGGAALSASLGGPVGLTVDANGRVFFAETNNSRIRLLTPSSSGAPGAPVPSSPANGATGVSLTPTLSWSAASGATSYDVYFGTQNPPSVVTNTTNTGYSPATLSGSTIYYWEIVAKNSGGSTASSVFSFTTKGSAPGIPVLTSPANGATGVSTTPTLSWSATSGATSYDVLFGTQFPPPLVTNTANTSYSPGTLNTGVTYYWAIVAENAFGSGASFVSSFTVQTTASPYQFVSVAPCRIIDTRNANGPLGGPYIAGSGTRTIPVQSSSCGVPANAVAYSLNITVVPRTGTLGYLSVWPTGQPQPLVSTLNSLDGSVLANAAIVPAGSNGSINAFATNDTELIVDINGAFVPPGAGTLQFYPLTPCRVLDTRNANGNFGGPALTGGVTRSFTIPSSGCGVPAGAAAYSLNVTVVPHGQLGYLSVWPAGQSQPLVSTLNSIDGTVLANAAIVPAGTNGAVSFFGANTTDLVVDINGVFAPPGTGGLNFYTVTPCRIADTRNANGTFGGPIMNGSATRTFPLAQGACGVPSNAAAYSLNVTVVPSGLLGYLAMWPTGGSQPLVSTLNALKGQVVANAALVPGGTNSAVNIFVTDNTHVIIDTNGYFGQ